MEQTSSFPMNHARFTEDGMDYAEFVAGMTQNEKRIQQMYDFYAVLTDADLEPFRQAVAKHGKIYAATLLEDWCPDAILNIPLLQRVAEAVDGFELHFFLRPDHPDLREVYAQDGIHAIPVTSFFNADWQEIGRWVETSPEARAKADDWKATNHPEIPQLRASSDPADGEKLKNIFATLFLERIKWFKAGLWRESHRFLIELLGV